VSEMTNYCTGTTGIMGTNEQRDESSHFIKRVSNGADSVPHCSISQ